jgi:UDP-3-O-[3-hydroxymyristoyl] glucosamine N-acyltransferase
MAATIVTAVAVLDRADSRCVTFCADRRHAKELEASAAAACFVNQSMERYVPSGCVALVTEHPQAAYAGAAQRLCRPRRHDSGTPSISPQSRLEKGVVVAVGAVVGPGAVIGEGTVISPCAVIGPGVAIGRHSHIGAGAAVSFALVGDRVSIFAGAVIGEAGFGAAAGPNGVVDIPQLGRVIIQDGVTIGSGTCVDRGAWDDTVVGENTKIDNLVQIAHNVRIGRNCLLAAHTGISGSVVVGDGCVFGGRAGIADHIVIGPGARIAAASGVMKNIPAGETWGGYPARPMQRWMRETAWLARVAAAGRRMGASHER